MEVVNLSDDEKEPMEVSSVVSKEDEESSGPDTDSSDSESEAKANDRAAELEQQIFENKYLYDAHIELVDIYRSLGDLVSMREAYKRFHETFPLTPRLWLSWIKDEVKVAHTAAERDKIFSLFEKAVEDYLSVELWIEYAQYSIGAGDLEQTRSIIERGLAVAALHVTDGSLLWDTLRELEYTHLSLTEPNTDQWKEQLDKVVDVFKRQLCVPLLNMESTYEEWNNFLKSVPENHKIDVKAIEWCYKSALKKLETYKPFEHKLLEADEESEQYEIWKEYIKSVNDPSTVHCLYERAVASLCLNPDLWVDYCFYVYKFDETAMKVCNRALRNVPWSEELWDIKLRILEQAKNDEKCILECFEQAIQSVSPPALELWLTYIEYVLRNSEDKDKLDKIFNKALQQVGKDGDPTAKLSRLYARVLAKRRDMGQARKIWNTITSRSSHKGKATVWLEFIALEREYGEIEHVRKIFEKALRACSDWPQFIYDEWLLFERQNGTSSHVMKCIEEYRVYIRNQKPDNNQQIVHHDTVPVPEFKQKRKHEDVDKSERQPKKFKGQRNEKPVPDSKSRSSQVTQVEKKQIDKDPKTTVFVSNLHPNVTESDLKTFFPNAERIELVLDRKGKSRCFGYVQFKMEEEVLHALARDREPIDGRPTFISNCKPSRTERKPVFKYSHKPESNKLFIKGLPLTKTQNDLHELFKPYGAIETRLVTRKNGESKGLAYVEFENEQSALEAMKATDQTVIDEHTITVAISAPPPKKETDFNPEFKGVVRNARSKLGVPLIPRQLQLKKQMNEGESSVTAEKPVPKSNNDFRKMLLNKN